MSAYKNAFSGKHRVFDMGLSIGGATGSLGSLRSSPDFGQVRLGAQRDPLTLPGVRQADDNGRVPFSNRPEPRQINVGIGQGLSTQGAALRTLNTTLELTRRTIPTIEQIRERFIIASSVRRDEAQRTSAEQIERNLTRRIESRIPEASAQARNFVSDIDEAADTMQARLEGAQAEAQAVTQAPVETAPEAEATVDTQAAAPTTQSEGQRAGFSTSENGVRLDVQV